MSIKAFDIPGILESYRTDVISGEISIEQAARELYKAGWRCFGVTDAKKLLRIK